MSRKLYSAHAHHSEKKINQNSSEHIEKTDMNNQNYLDRRPVSSKEQQKSALMDKYDKFIREEIYKKPQGIPRT